jgi:hypothetical protein
MSVSNKTLAIMLLAAIVVSLGGTFISLNRLGGMSPTGYSIAPEGIVNLTINSSLSITTDDINLIDFGTCDLQDGGIGYILRSNASEGGHGNSNCSIPSPSPGYIVIRNNGNLLANVSIQSSAVGRAEQAGGTFLPGGSDNSSLRFKIVDAGHSGNSGGCGTAFYTASYQEFENVGPGQTYDVCENLAANAVPGANSFLTVFEIVVPDNAQPGPQQATITYTASSI